MRNRNAFRTLIAGLVVLLSASCGQPDLVGTSGTGSTDSTGSTGGTGSTTATPASVTLLPSTTQLSSNAVQTANGVTLTAYIKDANQNVISGATVTFGATDTGVNLAVTRSTTDSSGTAQAILTVGNNKQNRSVVVTATSGGVSSSVTINIVGTTLTFSSGLTSAQFNTPTDYTVLLTDSGGGAIPSTTVQFSYTGGGSLNATSVTTDSSGQATVTLTPSSSGTLNATALGLTASKTVTVSTDSFAFTAPVATSPAINPEIPLNTPTSVTAHWTSSGSAVVGAAVNFSSTRGTITGSPATTNGSGDATVSIQSNQAGIATINANSTAGSKPSASLTVEFVATTPASISVQASPAVIGINQQSTITATVVDANNNLVKNQIVEFSLQDNTGGQLLSTGPVTTNSQGRAQVIYQASSTPSSANGVVVTATVQATAITNSASLTVGGAALRISLGTGNELSEPDSTTYALPYSILVTDSAGNPAPNAQVSLEIHTLEYGKGCSHFTGTSWVRDDCASSTPIGCTNEDLLTGNPQFDLNGRIDTGEDLNGNGRLEPSNDASVLPTVTLEPDGTGQFDITYFQDRAYWIAVQLTAVATVSGTESVAQVSFVLPGIASDFTNAGTAPPGQFSRYGIIQDCANPD